MEQLGFLFGRLNLERLMIIVMKNTNGKKTLSQKIDIFINLIRDLLMLGLKSGMFLIVSRLRNKN